MCKKDYGERVQDRMTPEAPSLYGGPQRVSQAREICLMATLVSFSGSLQIYDETYPEARLQPALSE
jgi:hypothetical protein